MTPLLVLLILYSAALIALGTWVGRRVRQTGDFFVSGRSLGAGLVFATFLAPNIGAGSTVGATSIAYQHGLAAWWWNGSAGIGSLVLALWIGPKIWRVASRHNLFTVGDFLEHHFGRGVRGLTAVLIWLGTLFILCGQLDGAATVLEIAGGVSHPTGCLVAAVVMTAYFVSGGLASAARVNGIQLFVKLSGFVIVTPLVLAAAGGLPAVEALNSNRLTFWQGQSPAVGWSYLLWLAPAFFLSPGLIQKAYGARDERALKLGVAMNAIGLMLFAFIPVLLGLAARALYPHLPQDQLALPTVLTDPQVPLAIGGLALAAVFSAEMSAADAVLFMLSTSGARDLYKGFLRREASDGEVLRVARLTAVLGGLLGYGLTFVYPSVVDALRMFYSILVVSLFAPLLGGLYLPRGGRWAAFAAIVVGVTVLVAVHVITRGAGYGWASPGFLGLIFSGFAYLVLAIF